MDRRTFMRATATATGSVGLAGCLDGDEDPTPVLEDGLSRYDFPPYSELAPAETHTGESVVVCHLRLSAYGPVQQAREARQLPDERAVELPVSSIEPVVSAVETISSYPFAVALRQAINDAAMHRADDGTVTNHTVVETNGVVGEPRTTNGTIANETVENGTTGNASSTENATVETTVDGEIDSGIDVTAVTLADELLVIHGNYDRSIVEDRYTAGFQQVDQQRGVAIYEDGSGRAFAVGSDLLVVPTENTDRAATGDTVLAHTLSGYINTLDRIIDDENGEWLFETTGSSALSLGVWGADDPLARVAETVGTTLSETSSGSGDPVFDGVDEFIAGLEPRVDDTGTVMGVETRFSGLFPTEAPTEDELRTGLAGGSDSSETHRSAPRAHLTALFGDT